MQSSGDRSHSSEVQSSTVPQQDSRRDVIRRLFQSKKDDSSSAQAVKEPQPSRLRHLLSTSLRRGERSKPDHKQSAGGNEEWQWKPTVSSEEPYQGQLLELAGSEVPRRSSSIKPESNEVLQRRSLMSQKERERVLSTPPESPDDIGRWVSEREEARRPAITLQGPDDGSDSNQEDNK